MSHDHLDKHLKTLSSGIRIDILKNLKDKKIPLSFRDLLRFVQNPHDNNEPNLSYHLNKLKQQQYIIGNDAGYQLTPFGEKILEQIECFENLIFSKNTILIRTSKYSFEPFDELIIEQKLIQEANMLQEEAHVIALEAKRRLLAAKIRYITAPLIREYINAILIEHHYEDYRHKLTRLGLPPFDIKNRILEDHPYNIETLRNKMAKSMIEQYVLLNQLSQKYADKLLSGAYTLTDLELFGLSPLEMIITGAELLNAVLTNYQIYELKKKKKPIEIVPKISSKIPITQFILSFNQFINKIKQFFPYGLNIVRFEDFLEYFLHVYTKQDLQLFIENSLFFSANRYNFSLQIDLDANFNDINPLLEIYEESLNYEEEIRFDLPILQIHLSKSRKKEWDRKQSFDDLSHQHQSILQLLTSQNVNLDQHSKWGFSDSIQIFSNLQIPIEFVSFQDCKPSIIVEKVSINLLKVFQEADFNENEFFHNLEKALFGVFDYFDKKCSLMSKALNSFQEWKELSQIVFKNQKIFESWSGMENYKYEFPLICAVSYHGLDELIYANSQLHIKDQSKNREFTIKILDFIVNLIQKQNNSIKTKVYFVLSESHHQKDILEPTNEILEQIASTLHWDKEITTSGYKLGLYYPDSEISFNNILKIFTELQKCKFSNFSAIVHTKNEENQVIFRQIKELLDTGICRISYGNTTLKEYNRYYHRYFKTNKRI